MTSVANRFLLEGCGGVDEDFLLFFLSVFVSLVACAYVSVCSQLQIFISNLSPPSQLQYEISKHTATIRYPSRTQRMRNLRTGDMSEVRVWGVVALRLLYGLGMCLPPSEYLCSVKRR